MGWSRGKLATFLLLFQIAFLVLYATLVRFDKSANPKDYEPWENAEPGNKPFMYSMFMDVHIMIFVGFGFLMTFLGRYSFSSLGLNMMIAAFCIQWGTIFHGFFHLHDGYIDINVESILLSDFACVAALISFGATIGRLSPLQLVVMSFIEVIVFVTNEYIGLEIFKAVDVGGSMFVHAFGAYFGLAVSSVLYKEKIRKYESKLSHSYVSDVSSMIGTQFLWICWPSFNAALAPIEGGHQYRAIINTYYALAACVIVSFAISSLVHWNHNCIFDMEHVQNATLAGGVAVGTVADLLVDPWAAVLIGMVAGTVSVLGYQYISPWMDKKFNIPDTCGVHNLHGMPALIAGFAGFFVCGVASTGRYGTELYTLLPMLNPKEGVDQRTPWQQAGYQLAALVTTLAFALVGGFITGVILRLPIYNQPEVFTHLSNYTRNQLYRFHLLPLTMTGRSGDEFYDDTAYWEVPKSGFPKITHLGDHVPSYYELHPEMYRHHSQSRISFPHIHLSHSRQAGEHHHHEHEDSKDKDSNVDA